MGGGGAGGGGLGRLKWFPKFNRLSDLMASLSGNIFLNTKLSMCFKYFDLIGLKKAVIQLAP